MSHVYNWKFKYGWDVKILQRIKNENVILQEVLHEICMNSYKKKKIVRFFKIFSWEIAH